MAKPEPRPHTPSHDSAHPPSFPTSEPPRSSDVLDDHWEIEATRERILWCRRKNLPYQTPAQATSVLTQLDEKIRSYPRSLWAILFDARGAPVPNSDPAMEAAIVKLRKQIFEGFAGAAVLVRTAAGNMQATRQAKEDGLTYGVFMDEKAAREYLAKCLAGKRRPTFF